MEFFKTFSKIWINVLFSLLIIFPKNSLSADALSALAIHPPSSPTLSVPAVASNGFSISEITPEIEARIRGCSYPEDCPVPLSSLRYLTVLHIGFDGLIHRGELIVNEQISEIILDIFYRLYLANYPIEKIILIDHYSAEDEASMEDNNTSAFCYRTIAGTDVLSAYSYGLAVDINPLYNPYISGEDVSPSTSPYDREAGTVPSPYFMTEDDYCVRLFLSYGFSWGGDWTSPTDYQHFEYAEGAVVK